MKLDILQRTLDISFHPKKESLWKYLSMSLISLCMKTWVLAATILDKDHSNLHLNNKLALNNILQPVVCYSCQISCLLNIAILCNSGSPGLLSTVAKLFKCEVTFFFFLPVLVINIGFHTKKTHLNNITNNTSPSSFFTRMNDKI